MQLTGLLAIANPTQRKIGRFSALVSVSPPLSPGNALADMLTNHQARSINELARILIRLYPAKSYHGKNTCLM